MNNARSKKKREREINIIYPGFHFNRQVRDTTNFHVPGLLIQTIIQSTLEFKSSCALKNTETSCSLHLAPHKFAH